MPFGAVKLEPRQNLPGSHGSHSLSSLRLELALYVPGGQARQSKPVPLGQKYPGGQGVFTVDISPRKPCSNSMKNNIDNFIKSANASLHCYRPIDGHVLHYTLALVNLNK